MELRHIIGKLKQLNILHRIMIHTVAAEFGIHFGQLPILEYVASHEKCSQRDLAQMMQVSPPSIATSVKRMQKAGLIDKTVDKDDLRYTHITVTPMGKELAKCCRERFNVIDQKMFEGFDLQEREQFFMFLERMIENMSTPDLKDKTIFALFEKEKELHTKRFGRCAKEEKTK